MTRVDEHGIPCIVQIINIIPEHYAILVCTYFDDEVLLFNRDIINPFSTPYGWDMEKIEQFLINKWLEFKGIKNGNTIEMVADRDYYAGETVYTKELN